MLLSSGRFRVGEATARAEVEAWVVAKAGQYLVSLHICNDSPDCIIPIHSITIVLLLSAFLYCIYVNGLFRKLRSRRAGCWIRSSFLGILGYADDDFCYLLLHRHSRKFSKPVKIRLESTIFSFRPTLIQQRATQSVWLFSRNPEFFKR